MESSVNERIHVERHTGSDDAASLSAGQGQADSAGSDYTRYYLTLPRRKKAARVSENDPLFLVVPWSDVCTHPTVVAPDIDAPC